MRFHVITLFPEMFGSFVRAGILGKAASADQVSVSFTNPRDFTTDRHRTVDDTPYGGGSGMVMKVGPVVDALESLVPEGSERPHRVLLTPQGQPFSHETAVRFSQRNALALVCGRYEGVDERVREHVDEEVSIGDFVLLGGEVAAMAIIEAVARLIPRVLGNAESAVDESHVAGLLEYPHYTRPPTYRERSVPDVLLSGAHAAIDRWRRTQALVRTRERRPDLFARFELSPDDERLLADVDEAGSS